MLFIATDRIQHLVDLGPPAGQAGQRVRPQGHALSVPRPSRRVWERSQEHGQCRGGKKNTTMNNAADPTRPLCWKVPTWCVYPLCGPNPLDEVSGLSCFVRASVFCAFVSATPPTQGETEEKQIHANPVANARLRGLCRGWRYWSGCPADGC